MQCIIVVDAGGLPWFARLAHATSLRTLHYPESSSALSGGVDEHVAAAVSRWQAASTFAVHFKKIDHIQQLFGTDHELGAVICGPPHWIECPGIFQGCSLPLLVRGVLCALILSALRAAWSYLFIGIARRTLVFLRKAILCLHMGSKCQPTPGVTITDAAVPVCTTANTQRLITVGFLSYTRTHGVCHMYTP